MSPVASLQTLADPGVRARVPGGQCRLAVGSCAVFYRSRTRSAGQGISDSAIADRGRFGRHARPRVRAGQAETRVSARTAIGFYFLGGLGRARTERGRDTDARLRILLVAGVARRISRAGPAGDAARKGGV